MGHCAASVFTHRQASLDHLTGELLGSGDQIGGVGNGTGGHSQELETAIDLCHRDPDRVIEFHEYVLSLTKERGGFGMALFMAESNAGQVHDDTPPELVCSGLQGSKRPLEVLQGGRDVPSGSMQVAYRHQGVADPPIVATFLEFGEDSHLLGQGLV
jgi:hypothetical protein